jgi:hypothetical protein
LGTSGESDTNSSTYQLIDRFNEEMIESLFGCHSTDKKAGDGKKDLAAKDVPQFVRILDAKKAQNLAISLKALSVSAEDVRSAVMEGKISHLLGLLYYISNRNYVPLING